MDKEEKLLNLIDENLNQDKSESAESLIPNDLNLREDKELYEKIIKGIQEKGEADLKDELDEYLEVHLEQESKKNVFKWNKKPLLYMSIAASFMIMMFYINFNNQNQEDVIMLKSDDAPIKLDSGHFKKDSLTTQKKYID